MLKKKSLTQVHKEQEQKKAEQIEGLYHQINENNVRINHLQANNEVAQKCIQTIKETQSK